MPNGRNAGRLFADCTGEHGYGKSHAVATLDGEPVPAGAIDIEVKCMSCGEHFMLVESEGGGSHLEEIAPA